MLTLCVYGIWWAFVRVLTVRKQALRLRELLIVAYQMLYIKDVSIAKCFNQCISLTLPLCLCNDFLSNLVLS